jgi:hypothetical protein
MGEAKLLTLTLRCPRKPKAVRASKCPVCIALGAQYKRKTARDFSRAAFFKPDSTYQLQPLVDPHVSHFSHVPLRTIVKLEHSEHILPV